MPIGDYKPGIHEQIDAIAAILRCKNSLEDIRRAQDGTPRVGREGRASGGVHN